MDFRDHSIVTQVAFKGAIDLCRDADLATPEGQAYFEQVFSYLTDSLMMSVTANAPEERAAQIIQGQFPGSQVVNQNPTVVSNPPAYVQPNQQPQPHQYTLSVRGAQHGPLPDWLFEAAAAKGVTEIYDNRDRAATNPKYPHFKSTSGGQQAPAFWPPRN